MRSEGADVVVVGSGAGGAAVAGELARRGLSVLVVEAGPQLSDRPGWNLRNEFPREDQLPRFGAFVDESLGAQSNAPAGPPGLPGAVASHAVGGMMVHWTNHCPEQHPTLERPDYIPAADWDGLLARARSLLHVRTDVFGAGLRQRRLLERLGAALDLAPDRPVQSMPLAARRAGGRLRYAGADDLLRGDAPAEPDGLRLLPRTIARRLHCAGDRVTVVEAASADDGTPVRLEASTFVVACGTLGTPQLLVASGMSARPALGRYLMEHPLVASRVVLSCELRDRVPEDDPPFAVWLPLSATRPWHVQVVRFHAEYSPVPRGFGPRDTADVFCFSSVEPRADNRAVFDPDRPDPFGLPAPRIEFALSADDRQRLADGIADQFRVVAEIADYHPGWAPQLLPMGGSTHLMGTARMGAADDGESVLDTSGRLWGYDNAFVAGNAVFSHANACNPTLTTVALALRTADAIAARARA